MPLRLDVVAGPSAGAGTELRAPDLLLVGRSAECGLQLRDPGCSRVHALVEATPERCHLLDLGSRNGTWVNGRRVTGVPLADGDEIRLGASTIRVSHTPGPDTATAGAPSPSLPRPVQEAPTLGGPETAPDPARYARVRLAGRGGTGEVWLAHDTLGDRPVALKILRPSAAAGAEAHGRFLREAGVSLALRHPHIVATYEAAIGPDGPYLAMAWIEGRDLEQLRAERGGRLAAEEAVPLALQALEALAYAHARGVVHRDVKPANLLVERRPAGDHVYLTDFGMARQRESLGMATLTLPGQYRGTLRTMPPEQLVACRSVDPRADLFSLGATLYELLTGFPVYDFPPGANPIEIVAQGRVVPVARRPASVPGRLAEALDRAIHPDRRRRYATAEEMRAALAAALQGAEAP